MLFVFNNIISVSHDILYMNVTFKKKVHNKIFLCIFDICLAMHHIYK